MTITIPACPGCCAPQCSDAETLSLVISGAIDACPVCDPLISFLYVKGISNLLNGAHLLSAFTGDPFPYVPPLGASLWRLVVSSGFTSRYYSSPTCSTVGNATTNDLEITVACVDGLYELYIVGISGSTGLMSYAYLWQTATDQPLGGTMTNSLACGGTATLTL